MQLTRRNFLASLATALPLGVVVRQAHAAAAAHTQSDPATLDALAEAVLPATALGRAGVRRASAAFRAWAADYREGAELNHGYGTSRLRTLGPSPLTRWTKQLDELDAAAQTRHQKRFRELSVPDRTVLVRAAVAGQRVDRMPSAVDAPHVALAVLAHFYDSSAATDLCYQAQIGRQTCRKLTDAPRKPLPMLKVSER
jgi:hypothetical protein